MFRRMSRIALRALHLDVSRRAEEEMEDASRANARRTAGRYSRGSVALQADSFVTRSDLERERAQVKKYKFAQ